MENGQKSISDLFEPRRIFNIPKYQRAYAWEQKQLRDFIEDFRSQVLGRDYFYGTILLQIQDSEGHFKIVDIVDGQQRITTLVIFMKVLLQKLGALNEDIEILTETYLQYKNEYRLRVLEQDNDFFVRYILEDNEGGDDAIETPSQRRLLKAKQFFAKQLDEMQSSEMLELREKIETAKVLTYTVSGNSEATLIFETTNDRGKPLTNMEKIKSFLMYKVYLSSAADPETHLGTIQARFGEIYHDLELIMVNLRTDEDFILRNHYITFEADPASQNSEGYSNHVYLLKDKINSLTSSPDTFEEATSAIHNYSRGLRETVAAFLWISERIEGDLGHLFNLDRVAIFFPILITVAKHCDRIPESDFYRICKVLEIISFRVYGIRKRKSNNRTLQRSLFSLAQEYSGDSEKLIVGLKDIIGEYCSDREFQDRLLSPHFYDDIGTNDLHYLFWRYENHIRSMRFGDGRLYFRRFRGWSIEHIASQNPRAFKPWMDEDFWNHQIDSIGNLVLDTPRENMSKSNLDFDDKYRYFYSYSGYRSQEVLDSYLNPESDEWDSWSIERRGLDVIKFALKEWDYRNI